MRYSTANWLALLFFVIGAIPVSAYFYLNEKDMMIPFLAVIVKPVGVISFFVAVYFLIASLMASRRQEKSIKKNHFKQALGVLLFLITIRVVTHLL